MEFPVKVGNQMRMIPERDRQTEPLCKFGPGGDFVAVLQPELPESSGLSNCFTRLMASAVEVAAVVLGLRSTIAFVHLGNTRRPDELTAGHKEKVRNAFENSSVFRATDTSPAPVAQDGRRFSREPMLFADVGRNGRRVEHKPKHSIRAHRRAAKKGSALRFSKQSTFFDTHFTSARIA
jgi:hypothetical protein